MARYISYSDQIVEIANSAYPTAVPVETLEEYTVGAILERSGYHVAADGTATYVGNIAASSAADSPVVGNTLMETKITTDAITGEKTLSAAVPSATTTAGGTSLLKGALSMQVNPVAANMAILTALGYEVDYINDHPEFWIDLSDALLGIDPDEDIFEISRDLAVKGLDLGNGLDVILRAKDAGGVNAYCEESKIRAQVQHLYDIGAFDTHSDLIPDIDESGTYVIMPGGCSYGEALSVIDAPMPDAEFNAEMAALFNANASGCNGMVVACQKVFWAGGGYVDILIDTYNIAPNTTMDVTYNNGTITHAEAIDGWNGTLHMQYDFYDGSRRAWGWMGHPGVPSITSYLNYDDTDYNVRSTLNSTYVSPPDSGLTPDPNATVLTDPADFDTLFAAWLLDAITTDRVNPKTGENEQVRWLPLKLWDYINDPSVGPNNQTAAQSGTLPGKGGDPDALPDYITDYLLPNINWPNFKFPETPSGNTPVVTAPTNSLSNKLYTVYNPTDANLNSLGAYLWDPSIVRQLIELFTNNPMDAIISLHQIYATPSTTTAKNIILGCLDSGVAAKVVTDQYVTIDCGSVNVPELYGDARDYTQVQCDVFLPFIGMRQIDCHDVICCSVNIVYHIDVYTGSTLAELRITKQGVTQTLYTFEGNCSVQIPLTAADRSRMVQGIVAATTGLITGGVGAMAGAAAASALGGAAQTSIQKSSGFSGNAGAMGCKKPYIVVTRQKSADASNYAHMIGNPTNKSVYIKDCRGFTRVKSVHLEIESATDIELNELEGILKQGILI